MDEQTPGSRWVVGILAALIVLATVVALLMPYEQRELVSAAAARTPTPVPTNIPTVELWLSTADRRLKLMRQPDIAMTVRGREDADVVVDVQKTYQSMVGFGAAMTDSSAWLLRHQMDPQQRSALLHELYGPPPGLHFGTIRLTIGPSACSLKLSTLHPPPFGVADPALYPFTLPPTLHAVFPRPN